MRRLLSFIALGLCLLLNAGCQSSPGTDSKLPQRLNSPRITVKKAERRLYLYDGEKLIAAYPIGLGFNPEGHKKKEGDGATPEGDYTICTRNPQSRFYKSLGLSYPGIKDAQAGLDSGLIDEETFYNIKSSIENGMRPPWNTPLGGEIYIHGHGSKSDWTAGCIAVEDEVMDELWRLCPDGTPVTILP